jgi:hypothetical protein
MVLAGILVVCLVFTDKFAQLTESVEWDPPRRYLTHPHRYMLFRFLYVVSACGVFILVYWTVTHYCPEKFCSKDTPTASSRS